MLEYKIYLMNFNDVPFKLPEMDWFCIPKVEFDIVCLFFVITILTVSFVLSIPILKYSALRNLYIYRHKITIKSLQAFGGDFSKDFYLLVLVP